MLNTNFEQLNNTLSSQDHSSSLKHFDWPLSIDMEKWHSTMQSKLKGKLNASEYTSTKFLAERLSNFDITQPWKAAVWNKIVASRLPSNGPQYFRLMDTALPYEFQGRCHKT